MNDRGKEEEKETQIEKSERCGNHTILQRRWIQGPSPCDQGWWLRRTSPRDQEGYDGDRELPPVATHSGDWDPVAIRVLRLK